MNTVNTRVFRCFSVYYYDVISGPICGQLIDNGLFALKMMFLKPIFQLSDILKNSLKNVSCRRISTELRHSNLLSSDSFEAQQPQFEQAAFLPAEWTASIEFSAVQLLHFLSQLQKYAGWINLFPTVVFQHHPFTPLLSTDNPVANEQEWLGSLSCIVSKTFTWTVSE